MLWEKPYVVWGWIAFGGGALLCFGAWRRLRQIAYEAFLAFRKYPPLSPLSLVHLR